MRLLLVCAMCLGTMLPAFAQGAAPFERATSNVVFTRPTTVTPGTRARPLIRRRDSILDGVLKGAALGFAASFLGGGDQCTGFSQVGCTMLATAAFAGLGGLMDAMNDRTPAVFPGKQAPTRVLAWRIRL